LTRRPGQDAAIRKVGGDDGVRAGVDLELQTEAMETSEWPRAEPLTTSRLGLEPLRVDHAAEMVAVLDDPALFTYTGGTPPTEADLRARYQRQAVGVSPDGRHGWLNWVLRLRATRTPIGTVQATLRRSGSDQCAELAWVVATRWQGAGYATEAASVVVAWLRASGVRSFEAHVHPSHAASAAVANRLGLAPTQPRGDGEIRWTSAAS
jgi:RimJ/RimL family protein N-acetyltransferase